MTEQETIPRQDALKELQRDVLSLEMELTLPIIESLLQREQKCREQWADNLPAVMALQGMEAVTCHIQSLQAKSHDGVLVQLKSLLGVLEITLSDADEQEKQTAAVQGMDEVLQWQQTCLLSMGGSVSESQAVAETIGEEDLAALLAEELKQTTEMVRREISTLGSELVSQASSTEDSTPLAAMITEEVTALHTVLQEELDKLRQELT